MRSDTLLRCCLEEVVRLREAQRALFKSLMGGRVPRVRIIREVFAWAEKD
jgi:hypothetical protein